MAVKSDAGSDRFGITIVNARAARVCAARQLELRTERSSPRKMPGSPPVCVACAGLSPHAYGICPIAPDIQCPDDQGTHGPTPACRKLENSCVVFLCRNDRTDHPRRWRARSPCLRQDRTGLQKARSTSRAKGRPHLRSNAAVTFPVASDAGGFPFAGPQLAHNPSTPA